jgi:nicotinate-nucleotide pyrophosphorylase (carboxylating)
MTGLDPLYIESVVKAALREDVGSGDITTLLTVPENTRATGEVVTKEDGVLCGQDVAWAVFPTLHGGDAYEICLRDGVRVRPGDVPARVSGDARGILTAERIALNFLQRMSGIATLTARYVDLVSHTKAKIVDTRKTTPGLRRLEKYAVTVGGGFNHRFGLSDGILIKDNHIAVAGGVRKAVEAAKARAPHTLKIEVEVVDLDMLREAIDSGADAVLLDNMPLEMMREAVAISDGRVLLEASGGVNESTVAAIAETGVDLISVGALTHSAPALDISLEVRVG